uniref:Uncharacterized protein n=1 Tax=Lynx canadensis TaxID=61383 RepID=A0A667GQ75_LYNCA
MAHEKIHLRLFGEKCANQHQCRTAEEKYSVSEKQLILWRLQESSTHHNSTDFKYMATRPHVATINSAWCEHLPRSWRGLCQLQLCHSYNLLFNFGLVAFPQKAQDV